MHLPLGCRLFVLGTLPGRGCRPCCGSPRGRRTRYIGSVARRSGIAAVHGLVHVSGSITVYWYSSVSGSRSVKRSINFMLAVDPLHRRSSLKLVVSITSVSPSQRPRASPDHCRKLVVQLRTSIEGDDARRVDHLGHQRHVIPGLNDLHVLVVPAGGEWRAGIEPEDAAIGGAPVFIRVSGMLFEICPSFLGPLLGGRRQRQALRPFGGSMTSDVRRVATGFVPPSSQKLL